MKKVKIISVLLLIVSLSFSCNPDQSQTDIFIEKIENGLLPKIILEGDSTPSHNILDRMNHFQVPGLSIAFLNDGKVEWARGYGITDTARKKAVNERTLFQAASISKPVAAMAALYFVEQGEMDLDKDVNQYLKGWQIEENKFTVKEKVTLRRILSHSAGLTVHGFGGYSKSDEIPGIIQILNGEEPANSGKIYPDTLPGSLYRYSGGGYTVMQKMLTDITGKEFSDLMDEIVLSKTGMESSTYKQPLPKEMDENAAYGHRKGGELISGNWHSYPEMAAAGLWTTPKDLLLYASEICKSLDGESNKVISQEMVREMLTPQSGSHGLGPVTGGEGDYITFSHGGANEGFRCGLYFYPKLGQGVAVMTNSDDGGALIPEIYRSFSAALDWPNYKPQVRKVLALEKEQLESFTGQFLLKMGTDDLIIELSVLDNHLHGIQSWDDFEFELYPEEVNKFFGLHDGVPFEFKKEADGVVSEMFIYEGANTYKFKKI